MSNEICATGRLVIRVAVNVRTTRSAAVTNHLSWMRSSPTAPRYRIATDTNETNVDTGSVSRTTTNSVSANESKLLARSPKVKGRAQIDVAKITVVSRSSVNSIHANQSAGFHRGDGRRPFGNSRNRNGS